MHPNKSIRRALTGQDGSTIVIALVILMAVTALGVTMMNLGISETRLVTNEKVKEDSFYDADACSVVTARFLRHLGDLYSSGKGEFLAEQHAKVRGVRYPYDTTATAVQTFLHNATAPFLVSVNGGTEEFVFQEDLGFVPELLPAVSDVRPREAAAVAGTAANQQNAGYSAGIGTGGAGGGGATNYFIIACEGRELPPPPAAAAAPVAVRPLAQSRIYVMYRRIIGNVSGGL